MLLGLGIVGDILQLKAEQLTWSTLKPTQAHCCSYNTATVCWLLTFAMIANMLGATSYRLSAAPS